MLSRLTSWLWGSRPKPVHAEPPEGSPADVERRAKRLLTAAEQWDDEDQPDPRLVTGLKLLRATPHLCPKLEAKIQQALFPDDQTH